MNHYFSVVIATKNRLGDLKKVIPAFLEQNYPHKEIIVIDNNSKDGTKEYITDNFPSVRYLYLPDNINILAQNLGVSMAIGDVIWRTDSDSHPTDADMMSVVNDYLNEHDRVDILSFNNLNTDGTYWYWYQLDKEKYFISDSEGYEAE